jgi:putative nucleotidyltransferase with HDIG domain
MNSVEELKQRVKELEQKVIERKREEKERRKNLKELQRVFEKTVYALASALEKRDQYTSGHQQRVAKLASAIGQEMNLPKEQIEGIRIAGILHDIGKIYIPAEILDKPNINDDAELLILRTHSRIGYGILNEIEFSWPVAQTILQHHERLNGTGYPDGITGKEITLEAKILSVADVIEAMCSDRPYRAAKGMNKVLEEILQNRRVLYDPDVVDAYLMLYTEKGFRLNN